jgi:hypothetical protein
MGSCRSVWREAQCHQLISTQRKHRVCPSVIITELDLIYPRRKVFDNRTDLPAYQAMCWQIFEERYRLQ